MRAGFGKEQVRAGKFEHRERAFAAGFEGSGRLVEPEEPSRDHQVDDQQVTVVEGEDDLLAQSLNARDPQAFEVLGAGGDGLEQGKAKDTELFQRLPNDALFQRFDVYGDVGQFGHC